MADSRAARGGAAAPEDRSATRRTRRYNDALTALDRAIRPPAALPHPAPRSTTTSSRALNDDWNILPAPPQAAGVARKGSTGFIWGVVGPYLQRSSTFNSLLVDHLNRSAAAQREAHRAAEATTAALREQLAGIAQFQARLMQYLQQITAYVDTKDRDTAGGALVLNASLSGAGRERRASDWSRWPPASSASRRGPRRSLTAATTSCAARSARCSTAS